MSTFRIEPNGTIYLYQWINSLQTFFKYSTRLKITRSKWNRKKMRPISPGYLYKEKNVTQKLIKIEAAFNEAWNYFQTNGGFSPIKLKERFKNNLSNESVISTASINTRFLDFFSKIVNEYKETKHKNSCKSYSTTLSHLNGYFGRKIPNFEDIDMEFYERYNKYLKKKNLAVNSISSDWKCIKAIMKLAENRRLHTNKDYTMFKRTHEEADTIFLTMDELERIYALKLTGYLDKARDYFIIGSYTGLRFADWDRVELSMIKDGILSLRSTKTGELSTIIIHDKVFETLKKYPGGKLPPKPSNQKLNEYIKEVVEKAEINELVETRINKGGKNIFTKSPKYKLVSTHTARRSFATNMILLGESSYLIMSVTGHRSLASFEKYVRHTKLQATEKLKKSKFYEKSEKDKLDQNTRLTQKERLLLLLP